MKKVIKGVFIVAILGTAAFFAYKAGYLDKFIPVSIEDTPNVVESVRNITELTTACYSEEIIQSEQIKKKDSLIIVAEGTVRAGFNLKDLGEDRIMVQGDTSLRLRLPKAQIFDVIVNQTDIKFLEGEDEKNEVLMNKAINNATKRIKNDAIKDGILIKATESGKKQLTELFKAFGFKEVQVEME